MLAWQGHQLPAVLPGGSSLLRTPGAQQQAPRRDVADSDGHKAAVQGARRAERVVPASSPANFHTGASCVSPRSLRASLAPPQPVLGPPASSTRWRS